MKGLQGGLRFALTGLARSDSMDTSLSHWLQLREPADAAARSSHLTRIVVTAIAALRPDVVRVLDLGTGTGANLRYLADHLQSQQSWLLVDKDATLLDRVSDRTTSWASSRGCSMTTDAPGFILRSARLSCHVETRQAELLRVGGLDIFTGRHLVTASALLDLMSTEWLGELAAHCRSAGATVLFAMNYNGHSSCYPSEPEDDMIRDLLNQHQRRDRPEAGRAAGPKAIACAARCFLDAGYVVTTALSNWVLGSKQRQLQRRLIDEWVAAAAEAAPTEATRIWNWSTRRHAHLDTGDSRILVGHVDLAAYLPGAPGIAS